MLMTERFFATLDMTNYAEVPWLIYFMRMPGSAPLSGLSR